jgi:hypothetical protein
MGAWGAGSFENDDALDWLAELSDSGDIDTLRETLETALACEPEEREVDVASPALAAAEVVAAALGRPLSNLPEQVSPWVEEQDAQALRKLASLARKTVSAIKTGSELRQLWEESDALREWLAQVEELERRLS